MDSLSYVFDVFVLEIAKFAHGCRCARLAARFLTPFPRQTLDIGLLPIPVLLAQKTV